jgi:hypothetical protein
VVVPRGDKDLGAPLYVYLLRALFLFLFVNALVTGQVVAFVGAGALAYVAFTVVGIVGVFMGLGFLLRRVLPGIKRAILGLYLWILIGIPVWTLRRLRFLWQGRHPRPLPPVPDRPGRRIGRPDRPAGSAGIDPTDLSDRPSRPGGRP